MKIVDTAVLAGPNVYADCTAIRCVMRFEGAALAPDARLPARFLDDLNDHLPGLQSIPLARLDDLVGDGTARRPLSMALSEAMALAAIALQRQAEADVSLALAARGPWAATTRVVYQYEVDDQVGRRAGRLARDLLRHLLRDSGLVSAGEPFDFAAARAEFLDYAQEYRLWPQTGLMVQAADKRGIYWHKLERRDAPIVIYGQGRFHKKLRSTMTGRITRFAVSLVNDKKQAGSQLHAFGLPAPRQELVRDAESAARAAERIGYPVVVKPLDANNAAGVTVDLMDAGQVKAAFKKAREHRSQVLVESMIQGNHFRLLVVNGVYVAATQRLPARVIGDGVQTVTQLVAEVNRDPRRSLPRKNPWSLKPIKLDGEPDQLLAKRGMTRDSVPAKGEIVDLRLVPHSDTGGTKVDATDIVHPDNRQLAAYIATVMGVDLCGIDFITPDICRSYREVGGAVNEVNTMPDLVMHVAPSGGAPRDVAGQILEAMFPPTEPARIPLAVVGGSSEVLPAMVAHILTLCGHHVGRAGERGLWIDGQKLAYDDMSGKAGAGRIFADPVIDAAVLQTTPAQLLNEGLAFRSCDVAAIARWGEDGPRQQDDPESPAAALQLLARSAREGVVLNADDRQSREIAATMTAAKIWFVTTHPLDDFLRDHVQRGGALVALESTRLKPSITASFEGTSVQILRYEELRCVVQRGRPDLVYDALFAAAIALGMGLSVAQVSDALRSFDTDRGDAAPSFEVVDWNGITCLLSAGHDPEAVARTCELAAPLQISGRRTVVQVGRFFAQNHATAKIGAALAGRFGRYICLEESGGTSGRAAPRDSLPSALIERGVAPAAVMTCDSEASAIDAALQAALAGDTILVLTDNFAATRQHISRTVAIETEGEADPPVNAGVG